MNTNTSTADAHHFFGQPDRSLGPGAIDRKVPLRVRQQLQAYHPMRVDLEVAPWAIAEAVAGDLAAVLDAGTMSLLRRFADGELDALVLVNAVPGIPEVKPTVYDAHTLTPGAHRAACLLAGLLHLAGRRPVSYGDENDGRVIRKVVANPRAVGSASSQGYDRTFDWHVDNPNRRFYFEPHDERSPIPEVLGFVALESDSQVPTCVALADRIVPTLSVAARRVLSEPVFDVHPPGSHQSCAPILREVPLLVEHEGRVHFRADTIHVCPSRDNDGEARAAIGELTSAADVVAERLCLIRGDILLIRNTRLLHKRETYVPRGESDRELLRVYGSAAFDPRWITEPARPWMRF